MGPAIRAEGLSKQYRLGASQDAAYRTLREAIGGMVTGSIRNLHRITARAGAASDPERHGQDRFWALKDVSFEVQPGEVVGIIGRNGAGKSTLLKILSRITEPTRGRAQFRGRIGSLLEVGTGFHQELTGRENIYLNGSILGMSRRDIDRRFDEIVSFAGIDRFLDTPVKRYSSGMYVRLAFAIAAHLEPDIMVVDEVLAVGDQAFQKKCLKRMDQAGRSGRTVLFVSHSLGTVLSLCRTVIVLDRGQVAFAGPADDGVKFYMRQTAETQTYGGDLRNSPSRWRDRKPILQSVSLMDSQGNPTDQVLCGEAVSIELVADPAWAKSGLHFAIGIDDEYGNRMMTASTYHSECAETGLAGSGRVVCRLAELPLLAGRYGLTLYAGPQYAVGTDVIEPAMWFDVVQADYYGNGRLPRAEWGRFLVRSRWATDDDAP